MSESNQLTALSREDAKRAFLNLFPADRRSFVSSKFLETIRRGASTPDEVLDAVRAYCRQRITRCYSRVDAARTGEFLAVLDAHLSEALDFAAYSLDYERLSDETKEALKREQNAEHIARWMANQPPSEKQLAYLGLLGFDGKVTNRLDASQKIDRLLERRADR